MVEVDILWGLDGMDISKASVWKPWERGELLVDSGWGQKNNARHIIHHIFRLKDGKLHGNLFELRGFPHALLVSYRLSL